MTEDEYYAPWDGSFLQGIYWAVAWLVEYGFIETFHRLSIAEWMKATEGHHERAKRPWEH